MLPIPSISKKCEEILTYLNNHQEGDLQEVAKHIDVQVRDLIKSVPLGGLSLDTVNSLDKSFFRERKFRLKTKLGFWKIYKRCNRYCLSPEEERTHRFTKLNEKLDKLKKDLILNSSVLDWDFITTVYTSHCSELIDLFQKKFPVPPLSIFPPDKQPQFLVERASQKAEALAAFKKRQEGNQNLEEEIIALQRHWRAKLRYKSELAHIGKRYFSKEPLQTQRIKAGAIKGDANTPYKPKCNPELSKRLQRAADQVKLFSSVTHLMCTDNISRILNDNLYGRENLINSYIPYRRAVLAPCDIENNDQNVGCLGWNEIDKRCLKGRTVGLELARNVLIPPELHPRKINPTFFFKQLDLGYSIGYKQSIKIGNESLIFDHTSSVRNIPV